MFSVGSKKEDGSSHLDTNPFQRALPSWLYLTQISPKGPISKDHPTVDLGFSSQQSPTVLSKVAALVLGAKTSVSIYPLSSLAGGAWEHGSDFKFSSGLTRNVKS